MKTTAATEQKTNASVVEVGKRVFRPRPSLFSSLGTDVSITAKVLITHGMLSGSVIKMSRCLGLTNNGSILKQISSGLRVTRVCWSYQWYLTRALESQIVDFPCTFRRHSPSYKLCLNSWHGLDICFSVLHYLDKMAMKKLLK